MNGLFVLDSFAVISTPGQNADMIIYSDAVSDIGVDTYKEIFTTFYMRECEIGEIL